MRDRLVEAGRARAASVGWPDAYAFTKALGEQALIDSKGEVPVSIVRPSIIESALAEPRPGWIRGFRMAEPVIISYARGMLREFPGVPEGTVDVIPVDLVVAAIITVAALGPDRAPPICQVASGGVNPFKYRVLVDNVSGWFLEHPLYDTEGQPIVVPEWDFPGRGRVQAQLDAGEEGDHDRREGAAGAAPARPAGGTGGAARDQADGGRAGARVRRAVRALHRVRGDLPGRPSAHDVGRPRRRRPGDVRLRSAGDRLAHLHPRRPSAVDRAARSGEDPSGQDPYRPNGSPAPSGPLSRPPRRRLRPREHPHREQRRRELLLAGNPAAGPRRAVPVRAAHHRRGARAAQARPS